MSENIEPAHWQAFLDDFAKQHHGYNARIEIIGRDFGDQEAAAWLPFSGVSYDPHHQQIFIMVGGISSHYPAHLTHTIAHPRMLSVHTLPEGEGGSILIKAEDKTETLVTLRRQPQLTT